MAWTIPTFDGLVAHGRPSNLRIAMFDLIRALDERAVAIGGPTGYTWWIASDPHIKQGPTFEDLEFLSCTGNKSGGPPENANRAYRNMQSIRDRIRGLIGSEIFVTESGGDTPYTIESMETAIGRGLDLPLSVQEASWWQAMQDALDLLIYTRHRLDGEVISLSQTHSWIDASDPFRCYVYTPPFADEREGSWDNRTEVFGSAPGALRLTVVGWQEANYQWQFNSGVPGDFTPNSWRFTHSENLSRSVSFPTNALDGEIVRAEAEYSTKWHAGVTLATMDVDINGTVVSFSSEETGQKATVAGVTIDADTVIDVAVSTTAPSSRPFDSTIFTPKTAGLNLGDLWVYLDLSPILTDQA